MSAVFRAMATPIVVTDLTGRVVAANDAYCALARRSPGDVLGALSLAFIHPDDWFAVVADVLSLIEGRADRAINERRHLRPDGTEVRLTVTASLLHRPGEEPLLVNEVGRALEVTSSDDLVLARAQAIHDAVQEGVSLHDSDGKLVSVTTRVELLLGRSTEHLRGRRWTDQLLRPRDAAGNPLSAEADPVGEAIARQHIVQRTLGIARPDGRLVWLAVKATPLPGGGAVSSLADLTELVTAEEDRARLAGIVQRTADLVFMWGRGARLTYLNDTARLALSLAPDDDPGDIRITELFPTEHEPNRNRLILEAVRTVGRWTGDAVLWTPSGRRIPVSVMVLAERDELGRFSRFSAVAHDLTSRVQLEAELEHRATRDPLTGLANRWLLHDQLDSRLSGGSATVVYLDLDGFKAVNDEQGHAAGDRLLIDVAECLLELAPAGALVSRPGGDEFVVVLPPAASATALLHALPSSMRRLGVQVSAGVATSCEGDDSTRLLARADRAMYGAKARPLAQPTGSPLS